MSKRTLPTGKQKDENSVIYEDVFDNNTDIIYTFTYDGVKEDIVLEKYNGEHTAILFDGKVFDNLFPKGIDYNEWISGFDAPGGKKTIQKIDF